MGRRASTTVAAGPFRGKASLRSRIVDSNTCCGAEPQMSARGSDPDCLARASHVRFRRVRTWSARAVA